VAALVALAYSLAVVLFVERHCYFYGDDYPGFLVAETEPLRVGIWQPIGGQVVPLARILNFAFFQVLGLNYELALAVLCAFHALGIWFFYRILALDKASLVNPVLVALYCSYVYVWIQLGWWSSGFERVPFVAFALMAIYYYLRWLELGSNKALVGVVAGNVLALGFYPKAILLPVCYAGVLVARSSAREQAARFGRFNIRPWLVAGVLFVLGVAFSAFVHARAYRTTGGLGSAVGATPLPALWQFVLLSATLFSHNLLGVLLDFPNTDPNLLVLGFWLLAIAYTLYRAPRTLRAWLALAVLLLLNTLMIGLSKRVSLFGPLMAFEIRYYWELASLGLLFLGLILHQLPAAAPEIRALSAGVRSAPGVALVGLLLAGYALVSYRNFSSRAFVYTPAIPQTKRFMDTLRQDLGKLPLGRPPRFIDGDVPVYVTGLDLSFRKHSQLLRVLRFPAEFSPEQAAEFRITPDGHVVPAR
jgi:hypothetical protein